MPFGFEKKRTLEEAQEENERLQVEAEIEDKQLSIAQKRAAILRLKQAGLTPKDFGGKWSAVVEWLKTH